MEPASKRQRLLPPLEFHRLSRFDAIQQAGEYEGNSAKTDEENEGMSADEEEAMTVGHNDDPEVLEFFKDHDGGPDPVLEERRRLLATKLKSKFEAIFEKYGKDFTGIGDEIDLETGRIIVDNGHLADMEDERDEGIDDGEPSILAAFSAEPDDKTESEEDSEVMADEEDFTDGHDDDMGLYESNDDAAVPSVPAFPTSFHDVLQKEIKEPAGSVAGRQVVLPSDSQIMAQFGDILGPQIISIVAGQRNSQQPVIDDSNIEPAWRVPGPPIPTLGKRPILNSILLQPDLRQLIRPKSKKPKHSSVWAPQMPRGRPRKDGSDAIAMMKGESFMRGSTWYSSSYTTTTSTRTTLGPANGHKTGRTTEKDVALGDTKANLADGRKLNPPLSDEDEYIDDKNYEDDEYDDTLQGEPEAEWEPFRPQSKKNAKGELDSRPPKRKKNAKKPKLEPFRDPSAWASVPKDASGRKAKTEYTDEDNLMLLQWVAELERQGVDYIFSHKHWKPLEEKNPRHTYLSWLDRYRKNYYNKKRSYNKRAPKSEEEYNSSAPDQEVLDEGHSPAMSTTLEVDTGDLTGQQRISSPRLSVISDSDQLLEPLNPESSLNSHIQPSKNKGSRSSAGREVQDKISNTTSSVTNAEGMENIDPRLFDDSWTSDTALISSEPALPPTLHNNKSNSQSQDASQAKIMFEPPASASGQPRPVLPENKENPAMKPNFNDSKLVKAPNPVSKRKGIRAPATKLVPVAQQSTTVSSTGRESEAKTVSSAEVFSRNIIDPSYDFSDDEDEPHAHVTEVNRQTSACTGPVSMEEDIAPLQFENGKPKDYTQPKLPLSDTMQSPNSKSPMMLPRLQDSVPPPQSPGLRRSSATPSISTLQIAKQSPLATPKTSRRIIEEIVDSDDMDELSIGGNELDLFAARPSRGSSAAPKSESSMRRCVSNARQTPSRATPTGDSKQSPYSRRFSRIPRTSGSNTRS